MSRIWLSNVLCFVAFAMLGGAPWLSLVAKERYDSNPYDLFLFIAYFIIIFMLFALSFVLDELDKLKKENKAYKRTLHRCNHKKYVHTDGDDEFFILKEDIPEIIECLYDIQKASEVD